MNSSEIKTLINRYKEDGFKTVDIEVIGGRYINIYTDYDIDYYQKEIEIHTEYGRILIRIDKIKSIAI